MNTAVFSPCRTWRYTLTRHWADPVRIVAFIGLNPSTADEANDDPTIRRIIGFAKDWGFDGLLMLNAFAYRSTDPQGLKIVTDPIGPDNDRHLVESAAKAEIVVACWGNPGLWFGRQAQVVKLLGDKLHCLGKNQNGTPKHPLYLPKSAPLMKF